MNIRCMTLFLHASVKHLTDKHGYRCLLNINREVFIGVVTLYFLDAKYACMFFVIHYKIEQSKWLVECDLRFLGAASDAIYYVGLQAKQLRKDVYND